MSDGTPDKPSLVAPGEPHRNFATPRSPSPGEAGPRLPPGLVLVEVIDQAHAVVDTQDGDRGLYCAEFNRASYHPEDVRHLYCAAEHRYLREGGRRPW